MCMHACMHIYTYIGIYVRMYVRTCYVRVYTKQTRRAKLIYANESINLYSWMCHVTHTKKYCSRVDVLPTHESCHKQDKSRCLAYKGHILNIRMNGAVIYAVLATQVFSDRSPQFFGNFQTSLFSMFQVLVLCTFCVRESSHPILLKM